MQGGEKVKMALLREKEWAPCSAPTDFMSGCRRAASFPFFGDQTLAPISVLKVRSQSESEGLNTFRFASHINMDNLRRRPKEVLQEREESSDCGSDVDSSSSDECESPCHLPSQSVEIQVSCTKERKSVRFADECDKELYCIRVMSEPSDQPPYISPRILRRWKGDSDDKSDKDSSQPQWKILFKQPASEYIRFREKLENDKVSLENVIVKADSRKIVGSIKVVNMSFEKKVFLRLTNNNWQSYVDKTTVYQPSTSRIYDTFTFEIDIPREAEAVTSMEFCVCYTENGTEHWDSNGGKNYKMESVQREPEKRKTFGTLFGGYKSLDNDDAYRQNCEWTRFASWKNLSTEGPYW